MYRKIMALTSAVLMAAVAATAYAATITYDDDVKWNVKMTAPGALGTDDGFVSVFRLGGCSLGASCAGNGSSGTFAPVAKDAGGTVVTWNYAKCLVNADNSYYLVFQAKKNNWPAQWPATLTCSQTNGGNTYTKTVTLADNLRTAAQVQGIGAVTFAAGLKIDLYDRAPVGNIGYEEMAVQAYGQLPAGTYIDTPTGSPIQATKAGVAWPDVHCRVDEVGTTDAIFVWAGPDATDGVGKCVVSKNGVATDFKVEVDRH